jgi:hypothetical protein
VSAPTAAETAPSRAVLDPVGAVGWRAGIMDGLNCTQRCIEAVLRLRGLGPLDVVRTFASSLDLLRRRSPDWCWPGCRIVWDDSRDPERNWALAGEHLARGLWPLVMIDRYHWPGDEHEGRRHVQSYVVLVLARNQGELISLGVHGDERDGYRHRTPITPELPLACWRVGLLDLGPDVRPGSPEAYAERLVADSVQPLADDLSALEAFAGDWRAGTSDARIGWPLGTLVFSDLEPQTFLLGAALAGTGGPLSEVGSAAAAAASAALRLGLVLLEANRSGDADAYLLARALLDQLLARLRELSGRLQRASARRPEGGPGGSEAVLERLATIAALCYPRELGEDVTPDRLRHGLGTAG